MTAHLENKLGMYIKVHDLLVAKAASLSGVSQVATLEGQLGAAIHDIMEDEGIIGADTRGFTTNKKKKRLLLEEIVFKVATAASAYFLSINDTASLNGKDFTTRKLRRYRDEILYTQAGYLSKIITPAVAAALSAFNSGPADVTALDSCNAAFLAAIKDPKKQRDKKRDAVSHQKKLFETADEYFSDLKVYMATFKTSASDIYNLFLSYQRIDDN